MAPTWKQGIGNSICPVCPGQLWVVSPHCSHNESHDLHPKTPTRRKVKKDQRAKKKMYLK
jgi:hypothetical protein